MTTLSSFLQPGKHFGPGLRYQLLQRLGTGGSGVVHLVHDRQAGRAMAGKFSVLCNPEGGRPGLHREGELLARLRHENIVAASDWGCAGPVSYLLMELLDGPTLATVLSGQRLSWLRATQLSIDIVRALQHAHAQGVLHLDLKPGNVLVMPDGHAKLIDFGAGRLELQGEAPRQVENEDFVHGTLLYMAPEQWALAALDTRTDIWAAGMLYYEMLTGTLPYGKQPTCLRCSSVPGHVVLGDSWGFPSSAQAIVSRTLALDPGGRFTSASALLEALQEMEHELQRNPTTSQ